MLEFKVQTNASVQIIISSMVRDLIENATESAQVTPRRDVEEPLETQSFLHRLFKD